MASVPISAEDLSFASATTRLEQISVPQELQASVERHQRHLAALVESLRAAGVGEEVIEASVGQLLNSYRDELTAAMRSLILEKSRA